KLWAGSELHGRTRRPARPTSAPSNARPAPSHRRPATGPGDEDAPPAFVSTLVTDPPLSSRSASRRRSPHHRRCGPFLPPAHRAQSGTGRGGWKDAVMTFPEGFWFGAGAS